MKLFYLEYKAGRNKNFSSFLYACLFILVIFASVSFLVMANEQDDLKKSIQIINPRPEFSLSMRLDKGTGATYVPGERIRIYFRTSKNAYVALFGYDSLGNIRLLFPNKHQKNHFVEANREYLIEGIIDPGTPSGFEYIQGFATTEPIIITRELEKMLEAEFLPKIGEGISRFSDRMKGILSGLPLQKWVSSEILHYQVVEQRSETGRLRLNSSPEGAEVFLDGRYAGKTPLVMEQIQIGEYLARVELAGYDTWSRTIEINPNRTTFINADLKRLEQYGSIAIRCNQGDARIYLDGQYKGLTEKNKSVILERVREGYHEIEIKLNDYIDWSIQVEVKPSQRVQLNVTMEKGEKNGSLEINCDVDNAQIYLDGKYQKRTSSNRSVVIDNIEEGKYELRITKEGYRDYVDTINIYSDHTYRIDVKMQPEYRKGSIAIHCNEKNAKIFINGIYKTTTSISQAKIIDNLKEGVYEITVIKDGYHTWVEEDWVYSGETSSVFADLIKIEN